MGMKSCFFIGHRSTLLNMASQNLSSVTMVDLTALQRQQSKKQGVSTQK